MQEYSITKCTKKCGRTGRPLEPGESYFSVILPDGNGVKRLEIAASEWTEPDQSAIGWWRNRMPRAETKRLRPAPNGVLLDTLSQLVECPGKEGLAYLLAVLLVRRRVLSEVELFDVDQAECSTHWALTCPTDGRHWTVPLVSPEPQALAALQQELNSLLFTEE